MTTTPSLRPRRAARRNVHRDLAAGFSRLRLGTGAALAVAAIVATVAIAPQQPADAVPGSLMPLDVQNSQLAANPAGELARDSYAATPGVDTLASGGTNYDWAKLVLLDAGFPMTENNITVLTRWMRQENGPDNWFNRNNPLNNGWGSGGNSGLNPYPNLRVAAENVAAALHGNPSYSAIVAAFAESAPTSVTEQAIWASPWASSHYANGGHWAYTSVPVITAPKDAW